MSRKSSGKKGGRKGPAKQSHKQSHKQAHKQAAEPAPPPAASAGVQVVGAVLLAVATLASLMLVLGALGGMRLPGCGPDSACAALAKSVWGRVPLIGWPTSHVGLAFFLGLLAAWLAGRGTLPPAVRWIVRLGAVVSVILTGVMVVEGHFCQYCLAAHLANLLFVGLVEAGAVAAAPGIGRRGLIGLGAGFVLATGVLAVAQSVTQRAADEQAQDDFDQSTQQMTGGGADGGTDGATVVDDDGAAEGFTGRYRQGPENAPIRIVIISDYQCPDCYLIEQQARRIMDERDDVSISAKHFPFCKDCNAFAAKRNFSPHPNACWAARAAETAGKLYGNEGFWKMHHWLFDQKGSFTDAELKAGLAELGLEPPEIAEFTRVMQGPEVLELVEGDVAEAIDLGLYFTPMIFINGVELRGWQVPNALVKAVDRVAATNPAPGTAADDRPDFALEKYIGDWRQAPRRTLPPDEHDWGTGPKDAPVQVTVWGDYQEPFTCELDARLRAVVESASDVRYAFRHYPFNQECNESATRSPHEWACVAARAAEAAGQLAGPGAYWAMHTWLTENRRGFSEEKLWDAAREQGLDPDALKARMDAPEVAEAITADARAAKRMGLRSIPFLFVNGQHVVRWRLENERVPELIIEEARNAATASADRREK